MKNILRILPFILILTLSGCDFLKNDVFRILAGRPTESEIDVLKEKKLARRRAVADSIEAVRIEAMRREVEREDSVSGAQMLVSLGIKKSSVSRFGKPVSAVPFRYNAIVGVYRQKEKADNCIKKFSAKGYVPYFILFEDEVRAVCICGDDTMGMLAGMLSTAMNYGDCPAGTWVYIRE